MTKFVLSAVQPGEARPWDPEPKMRIVFADNVLRRKEAWRHLTRLLYKVDDGWHLWEISDPDLIEDSPWYKNRAQDQLLDELFRESAVRSAWGSDNQLHAELVLITDYPTEDKTWELQPEQAIQALEEPLRLIVEDRESDGLFFKVILRTLGSDDLVELCSSSPPPLEIESPGGSGKLRRHAKANLERCRQRGIPARVVMLFDSDAAYPGHVTAEATRNLEFCQEHGIPHHMLAKRAMENYVPQEALQAWAAKPEKIDFRRTIAAVGRLSRSQRDHLPKTGLVKGLPPDSGTLYVSLAENEQQLLTWSPRKVKPFEEALEDHQDVITAENLRERCGPEDSVEHHELDQFLEKISRLL